MSGVKSVPESSSEESCLAATGKSYEAWFQILDTFDLRANGHTKSAHHLRDAHGVPYWWCQQITIAYEQKYGLRQPGQRSDGKFAVNVSKTINVSAERAWEALTTADGWDQWFTTGAEFDFHVGGRYSDANGRQGVVRKIKPIGPPNSYGEVARLDFTWESATQCPRSIVSVQIIEKGPNKVQIALTHSALPGPESCAEMKEAWSSALTSLKSVLETGENPAL